MEGVTPGGPRNPDSMDIGDQKATRRAFLKYCADRRLRRRFE